MKSINQIIWEKEINRIKRFIKRATKRGYKFDFELPDTPKRITQKMLKELRAETTPTKLYAQAEYSDLTTGEILTGKEGRKRERQKASKKGQQTKRLKQYRQQYQYEPQVVSTMYFNLRDFLKEISTTEYSSLHVTHRKGYSMNLRWMELIEKKRDSANYLLELLDDRIATEGESKVFTRLEANRSEVEEAMNSLKQASTQDEIYPPTVMLATYITGGSLSRDEAIAYTDYSEVVAGLHIV